MPEIIEPGSGGLLVHNEDPVELAETIAKALADDTLYEECARTAPRRRAHYTWERAATQVLAAVGSMA
jgi:glycosyltransferase involved in cell wall biosynthesis